MMWILGLIELVCMVGIPVTLIGFIIQAIRKKPNKKAWGLTCVAFLLALIVCVAVTPTDSFEEGVQDAMTSKTQTPAPSDKPEVTATPVPTEEPTVTPEPTTTPTPEPEVNAAAKKFAKKRKISQALAQSVENALGATQWQYGLDDVITWEQTEDWAQGQRYNATVKQMHGEGWLDAEKHYFTFYVTDDEVVSIREGLDYVYDTRETEG